MGHEYCEMVGRNGVLGDAIDRARSASAPVRIVFSVAP
jgi:hypothetical protein